MITKLPKWVWFGAGVLALIAGMVNAVGFLGFQHHGITHLTGSTTLLGIAVAERNLVESSHLFAVVGSFVAGCVLAGFLIQDSTLKLGRRYGVALLVEAILLFVAIPLLRKSDLTGDYLASCAMGLQNGMVSTYSGALLRTTHVTGAFTDIGIALGHFFRGLPVDTRRVKLCFLLLLSFAFGAAVGALGFKTFEYGTLYFPAVLTGMVGLAYGGYQHVARRRSSA